MVLNLEAGAAGVRRCKLSISTGGVPFLYPIKAAVKHNRWYQANTFEVKIRLYGDPAHDIDWWGSNDRIEDFPIEITYTVEDQSQTMMTGQIDRVSLDVNKGIVTAHGRDNASFLIDTMTKESFPDRTVSDLVKILAERVGLKAVIENGGKDEDVGTLNTSGHYVLNIGASFGHFISYWDLLSWMAKSFNYYLYVDGDTIFFRRQNSVADVWQVILKPPLQNGGDVVKLEKGNTTTLILDRDFNIARNASVMVYSYDAPGKKPIIAFDERTEGISRGGNRRTMQYVMPGLRDEKQAQELANNLYTSTISHEKKVHWAEPGDLFITCQQQVRLTQGETAWNQNYFFESIERLMDFKGGFTMLCSATNSDPELSMDAGF